MTLISKKTTLGNEPVYVTQPHLPPLEDFIPYLQQIWANKQLTNNGPMHQELEKELAKYLGVPYIALFNNGTNALLTALQALDLEGEVITTPYSFVATSNAIVWNKLNPVFVDIDPISLNLDPSKIEAAITDKTSAIMPVHCYGNPCDVLAIKNIADKYNLKVIYDAAHAFAVKDNEGSILRHGDLSALSFHATKVFNTFEGGAIICHTPEMKRHIDLLKNFGIADEVTVINTGINGKMSEINAAFGLLQLQSIDHALTQRGKVDQIYRNGLQNIKGIIPVAMTGQTQHNYAYFPILVTEDYPISRDELYHKLKEHNVNGRRYFYPLISQFKNYQGLPSAQENNLPVATKIAQQVICLPIYPGLENYIQEQIIEIIGEI